MAISYTHGGHVFSLRVLSLPPSLSTQHSEPLVWHSSGCTSPSGWTLHSVSSHSEGPCIWNRYIFPPLRPIQARFELKDSFKCVFITWDQISMLCALMLTLFPLLICACLSLSLMLPCCCDTNQDSALGLWPVHPSTSLWFWAGVLDTLFSPFLVIFPSLNLWHDYFVFQSHSVNKI